MRGTGGDHPGLWPSGGITPACAGNSGWHTRVAQSRGITPACAGNRSGRSVQALRGRITPACAGNSLPLASHHHAGGITPACAGNRRITMCVWPPKRDHPRVCGEQPGLIVLPRYGLGSPPRVRGTGFSISHETILIGSPPRVRGTGGESFEIHSYEGITPACAGNRSEVGIDGIWE